MMEAAPAPSFVVPEAQFLFQLLIIALDPPAQFGQIDQAIERHVRRNGGQPVFGRLGLTLRPFDQPPFPVPRRPPPRAIRPPAIPRPAARSATRRGGRPAPEPGQSERAARPPFPRARKSSASFPPASRAQAP